MPRAIMPGDRKIRRNGMADGLNAYCDSDSCRRVVVMVSDRGVKKYKRSGKWVLKSVPLGTKQCPECGYALYWMKL